MNTSKNAINYYNLDGTIRAEYPEKTLKHLNELLPLFGITRVANITGLDNVGISVATCIRPNAKHLSVSQGKGFTQVLAEVSAIMEAIEAYHAENYPDPVFNGAYTELKKQYPLVNPNLFNKTKFINKNLENLEIGWSRALNLRTSEEIYIPHILACLDSTQPHLEYAFLSVSTNGLAAGNTDEEAICHALYELIERDALFHWRQFSGQRRKEYLLSNESIDDEINKTLVHKFKQANLFIKIWEITSKLGIPTFHCALYDENLFRSLGLFTGTGTHLSKEIALSRALMEVAQARLTLISGNRDDIFPDYYHKQQSFNRSIEEHLLINGNHLYQNCSSMNYQRSFTDNIKQITSTLLDHNYDDIYIINHTKLDINIKVVQAFVPGLQFNGSRM